jgi:hypothetical protein
MYIMKKKLYYYFKSVVVIAFQSVFYLEMY